MKELKKYKYKNWTLCDQTLLNDKHCIPSTCFDFEYTQFFEESEFIENPAVAALLTSTRENEEMALPINSHTKKICLKKSEKLSKMNWYKGNEMVNTKYVYLFSLK